MLIFDAIQKNTEVFKQVNQSALTFVGHHKPNQNQVIKDDRSYIKQHQSQFYQYLIQSLLTSIKAI